MDNDNWKDNHGIVHSGKVIAKSGNYNVIDCNHCRFSHITPIPSETDLEHFYSDNFYAEEKPQYIDTASKDHKWIALNYQDKFESINSHFNNNVGRALDIGSGPGGFLIAAQKYGWDAVGIEPGKLAVDYCKSLGLTIIEGFFNKSLAKTLGKFDLIHLSKVLEHISNPHELVQTSVELLNDGGLIVITVPNDFNDFQNALINSGKYKEWWVVPEHHINYFNFTSLEEILITYGLNPVERFTDFPMDMFLLMDQDYTSDPSLGKKLHSRRKSFDLFLNENGSNEARRNFYKSLANVGLGRNATIIAKK